MPRRKRKASAEKKILIVDDHPIMRLGLAQTINRASGLTVCGEAADEATTLKLVASRKPDLVLVDISLPGRNGIELIKSMKKFHPNLPVLVMSMHDEAIYAERTLRAGGRGYIMKHETGDVLIQAINRVLGGQIYLSEKIATRILENLSGQLTDKTKRSPFKQLSDREFEVFELIGHGLGTAEIAERLKLSSKTIDAHRTNIRKKLEIKDSKALLRFAVRWLEGE